MDWMSFSCFLIITVFTAFIAWRKTKRHKIRTVNSLFLANRSLNFMLIGAALLFSNINTATIIGENELVYTNNMSVMAWGLTSVLAMLVVSELFMPIYLKTGITTTPDYLEARYDKSTKTIVTVIFLVSYVVNLLPSVLYTGAVAFIGLFQVSELWHIDYWTSLWIIIWLMGMVGCLYAVLGGMRAIAISDTMLGLGIFVAGIALPYFGFKYLGNGDWHLGLKSILDSRTEHLNSIGGPNDAVPFGTLFTGMLLMNLYYWGTEQYIVQQVLASKDLATCQKGIAVACFGKIVSILMLNIPGLIAVHLLMNLDNTASVFPALVRLVSPPYMTGYIAAIVFGASLTTFNAGLNSASTLFTLNIYKPWREKRGLPNPEKTLLKYAKRFELAACLCAVMIAPFIFFAKNGFYNYIQTVNGFFSLPIFTIIVIGFLTRKVPPLAAKVGLIFFTLAYGIIETIVPFKMHFLHVLAILFVITSFIMLVIGRLYPLKEPYKQRLNNHVAILPWKHRHIFSVLLVLIMLSLFWLFSPLGIVK